MLWKQPYFASNPPEFRTIKLKQISKIICHKYRYLVSHCSASYFRSKCDLLQIKHQNNNCDHFATFITDSRQNSENHFKKTQTKAPYKSKNRHKSLFQGNSKVKVNILCETSKLQASKIYKASLCNSYKNQIQNCGIKLTEITVLIWNHAHNIPHKNWLRYMSHKFTFIWFK